MAFPYPTNGDERSRNIGGAQLLQLYIMPCISVMNKNLYFNHESGFMPGMLYVHILYMYIMMYTCVEERPMWSGINVEQMANTAYSCFLRKIP